MQAKVYLRCSTEFIQVLRHFFNLSVEMFLDFLDESGIGGGNKVDSSSLSTKSTSTTNSVNVVFFFERKFIVNDKTNLLNINTTSEQVSGDENSC
jgi:hypothetical protein